MRIPRPSRRVQVAIATAGFLALSLVEVVSVAAVVTQGLAVSKGCDSPTAVGSPYTCVYTVTNSNPPNPSNNTLVVSAVSDTVFGGGGNATDSTILPDAAWTLAGGATCVGGGGTPYVGATSCTLPFGASMTSDPFTFYTVANADFKLPGSQLADQVTVSWHSLCNVSGTAGCNAGNQTNQAPGASDITPGQPSIVTHATSAIAVGQTASDTATISGLLGSTVPAGSRFGSIVFTLFGPSPTPNCDPANLVFTSGSFDVFGNSPPDIGPATSGPLTTPGNYYWIASFTDDATTDGGNANATTSCGDAGETTVVNQPDANIQITPATATNAIGTNHVLTIHVNVSNDGSTFTAAPDGTSATASILSGPGSFVGSPTCTTTGGTCTVTITSAIAGTTVVQATTTLTVNTVTLTRTTGDANAGDGPNAEKVWVDANIQITPATATNPVGTNHVLTITVNAVNGTLDAGPHTATASIVSGPGSFVGSPSCTYTGGGATASCTVTITSAVAGTTTVSATSAIPVSGQTITRATGDANVGDGPNAQKVWQQPDANIQITPATATNPVGTNHVLTITINVSNDGSTFTAAPDGTSATASILSGPGSFVGSPTCTTTGGTCTVTITSAIAGTTVVQATTTLTVNTVTLTRTTGDANVGDGPNAEKVWVQPDANIQISPLTADNPTNTNHTLTGHVNVSDDSVTYTNAPAGTLIDFSIVSGPGSFVGGVDSCTTIGTTGSCTVQITSAVGGTTVVRATTTVTVAGSSLTRTTHDGLPGDSDDAQKTWHPPVTGGIFPTQTSCTDFTSGTATLLPGINYTVTGGNTIGQNINPGVFFYFSTVTTTVPNQVVTTSQTTTNSSGALFKVNQGHAWLWTSDCVSKQVGTLTNSGATASFTVASPGTYIIQIQYQTKSLAGTAAPSPINPTYTFDTDNVDNATIQLFKK